MARFIEDTDYDMQIKQEILALLKGTGDAKLLRAEGTAVKQLLNWLSGRFDMDTVMSATGEDRDQWIITIIIDMALYHLYSQTGHKDVPMHRTQRYQDALDWLKMAATGEIGTTLPVNEDDNGSVPGDPNIFSLYPPEDQRW